MAPLSILLFMCMALSLYSFPSSLKAGMVIPLTLYSRELAQCLELNQRWTDLRYVNELAEVSWLVRSGVQKKTQISQLTRNQ